MATAPAIVVKCLVNWKQIVDQQPILPLRVSFYPNLTLFDLLVCPLRDVNVPEHVSAEL
jgi:hypothetical protein